MYIRIFRARRKGVFAVHRYILRRVEMCARHCSIYSISYRASPFRTDFESCKFTEIYEKSFEKERKNV